VTGSGDLKARLERLLALVQRDTGLPSLPFNRGCSDDRIRALEDVLGFTLPADYTALLRARNGQFDRRLLTFPPDELAFLSDAETRELWTAFAREAEELSDELQCGDRVRWLVHHPGRVPIAYNEDATRYACIDLIPGPRGRIGQVVFNPNEVDVVVLEASAGALLDRYIWLLESGRATIERRPPEYDEGYWWTVDGRYLDYELFREITRSP
jgi:cell wall assembly regulator SMI1